MVFDLLFRNRAVNPNDVAIPLIVKYVACPYCNVVFTAMTLAALRPYVDPVAYVRKGGRVVPNPLFKESHLANPIKCPDGGHKFWVFAGVMYGSGLRDIRAVHIVVAKDGDPVVRDLARWPHRGLVDPMVVEYSPSATYIYNSIEHYEKYNGSVDDLVSPDTGVSNLAPPPLAQTVQGGEGGEPVKVELEDQSRVSGWVLPGIFRNMKRLPRWIHS